MDTKLTELEQRIRDNRAHQKAAPVEAWIDMRMGELRPRIRRLRRDNAFERFLLGHLDEWKQQQREGEQPAPCECDRLCSLKEGRVPPAYKLVDTVDEGVHQVQLQHQTPRAFTTAYEEFDAEVGAVERALRQVNRASIRNEVPPDADPPDGYAPADLDEYRADSSLVDHAAADSDADTDAQEVPADDVR